MAVTIYDYETNQWYVGYADGTIEPCANAASAQTLKRLADASPKSAVEETATLAINLALQLQEAC